MAGGSSTVASSAGVGSDSGTISGVSCVAAVTSGTLHAPASAIVSTDDAIRFAVMSLVNQIDFSS